MTRRKLFFFLSIMTSASIGGGAVARPIPVTLLELVNYSDAIVEGVVERGKKTESTLAIRVATVHRGAEIATDQHLPLRSLEGQLDEAKLIPGKRYLFFLAECTKGYRPIFGYAGRVPIADDDTFSTGNILDQPESSSRKEFLKTMRDLPNLPTLHAVPREWLCRT